MCTKVITTATTCPTATARQGQAQSRPTGQGRTDLDQHPASTNRTAEVEVVEVKCERSPSNLPEEEESTSLQAPEQSRAETLSTAGAGVPPTWP